MSAGLVAEIERDGGAAVVHLRGDVAIPTADLLYQRLTELERDRGISSVVLDFRGVERVDSSAAAAVALFTRRFEAQHRTIQLDGLDAHHRAALGPLRREVVHPRPGDEPEHLDAVERVGERVLATRDRSRQLAALIGATLQQLGLVVRRRARLPEGSVGVQIALMGVNGIPIVALLALLLGTTMAFQGAVQLHRFGADVFVADMLGWAMVRELAPLITAVILTGRTGAAIAAELGTMRVRSEIDALATMGIDPVRYLIVPRMVAITIAGPALTLLAMFVGMLGGMLVAVFALQLPVVTFWTRITERVQLTDFAHGLLKSVAFAWIIGLAGCVIGLRATLDARGVGRATTRTVVTSIFFIIVVDAIFVTIATIVRYT